MADRSAKDKDRKEDDELDELLDSALEDFDSKAPLATKHSSQTDSENGEKLSDSSKNPCNSRKSTLKTEGSSSASASSQQTTDHARSGVDFSQVAGLEDLENAMKSILGDEPELLAQLEQFAQAAASAEPDNPSSEADLEANLARTMNHLAQNAKDLENAGSLNEDFFKSMADMNLSGGDGDMDFLPLMQGMMQNLLSKDVLYPALKDLREKYPGWLEDNKVSLTSEEFARYDNQYKVVGRICSEYEAESSSDSDDVRKKRFEKLLGLMQQMQECGQPPSELVGEMPPGFPGSFPEMPQEAPELPDELKNECKVS